MITISVETIKTILAVAYLVWVVVLYVTTSILVGRLAKRLKRSAVGYTFLSIFLTPFAGFLILLIVGAVRERKYYSYY